jgi:hypothetical protein
VTGSPSWCRLVLRWPPAYAIGEYRGREVGRRQESERQDRMRADEARWEEYRREFPEEAAEEDRRFKEAWSRRDEKDSGRS